MSMFLEQSERYGYVQYSTVHVRCRHFLIGLETVTRKCRSTQHCACGRLLIKPQQKVLQASELMTHEYRESILGKLKAAWQGEMPYSYDTKPDTAPLDAFASINVVRAFLVLPPKPNRRQDVQFIVCACLCFPCAYRRR